MDEPNDTSKWWGKLADSSTDHSVTNELTVIKTDYDLRPFVFIHNTLPVLPHSWPPLRYLLLRPVLWISAMKACLTLNLTIDRHFNRVIVKIIIKVYERHFLFGWAHPCVVRTGNDTLSGSCRWWWSPLSCLTNV